MRIVYCGIERYESRYSHQLTEWNIREFKRLGINHIVIEGSANLGNTIKTGLVLDAHARCLWALEQIKQLVYMHKCGQLGCNDFILFEDMFHPGIEALAYLFSLVRYHTGKAPDVTPRIGVRCLAQTIDPDDFVHYTGMVAWMRKYEQMVNMFIDVVFMASEEMLPFATAAGWNVPCFVTGLPFGKQEVLERLDYNDLNVMSWDERKLKVLFTSRIANEKQPEFFIALAERFKHTAVEFAFVSGGRISDARIDAAVLNGLVSVYANQTKEQYYQLLNESRVVVNTALQDWVSNTVSEADALGCNVLFPGYRSFSEVFNNDHKRLYVPWSLDDATTKLHMLLKAPYRQDEISDYQDKSIERTIHFIQKFMVGCRSDLIDPQDTSYRQNIVRRALR